MGPQPKQKEPRLRSTSYHVILKGCPNHPEGCHLHVSEKGSMIVVDFNTEGAMVGIEFVDGFKSVVVEAEES